MDVVPAQRQNGEAWYAGTADAVARWVLVLAGGHVYKVDDSVMLAEHVARGSGGVTVACTEVPLEEAPPPAGRLALARAGR
ncbi:MAG: hypothetical protein Fur0014_15170 [Rubrivivax sp.]